MSIHRIPVPTPFQVGPVNLYLVEDDPLTLVDAGPDSGRSLVALERGLAEHGRRIEDLERIVLTHQHIDHIGLAQIIADRSGAEVVALAALAPWLADYGTAMEEDDQFAETVMLRHGLDPMVVHALRAVVSGMRAWGAAVQVTEPVEPGAEIGFADRTWTVLHRPGHSPSDTVFHDAERGELVGGDHLIGHISSNPLISRPLDGSQGPRPRSLLIYLASLRATQEMELQVVHPGHGEPVTDHKALIDTRIRMHDKRAAKILGLLRQRPHTAHEVAHALWGSVALQQAYLTLSEVLGHVDLLVARGQAVEEIASTGAATWRAA